MMDVDAGKHVNGHDVGETAVRVLENQL